MFPTIPHDRESEAGPPMTRRIAVLTPSRADFGHLYWPIRHLSDHPDVELEVIVAGAHLSAEYGRTIDEIRAAGIGVQEAVECLLSSDTDVGMAKTIGVATLGLADVLARRRPDLLLLIADRYEMLAPAAVALALRIPVAHIEGGDVSEGAIDDAVRNALTKLAHLHFTTTETARRRVIAMGEEPWRVHRTGSPSLDRLAREVLPSRTQLESRLGFELSDGAAVVALHPVTLLDDTLAEADPVLAALSRLGGQQVFCFPNPDAGSRELVRRARAHCDANPDAHLFVNLEHRTYWALLRDSTVMIGNSSSGIMETPSLGLPTVNVGIRQRGRERADNVIDVPAAAGRIVEAVERARSPAFRDALEGLDNPYGDGTAGERIAAVLATVELDDRLIFKRARPVTTVDSRADVHAFTGGGGRR